MPSWYSIQNRSKDEAEILIYEEIGAWGITAKDFVKDLEAITAKRINVRLNTPGGEVFDGTAIHNALKNHPAEIIIDIDGIAASAGSFIAMSGDEIHMADNAYMMIHNARGGVMGEADDMLTYAGILEKIDGNIAQMYAEQSGNTPEHYRKLMDEETWFTAEEALDEGLIDSITKKSKQEPTPAKSKFDFTIYNVAKIPEPVKRLWGIQSTNKAPEASPCGDPPSAITKEISPMANEPTPVVPAPTPDAPSPITPNQEIARLNDSTIQSYIEKGRAIGRAEGRKEGLDELRNMAMACPGRPQIAIDSALSGQNVVMVKLIVDAERNVEMAKNQESQAKDIEIAKLQADRARLMELQAYGGHPGGVSMGMSSASNYSSADKPEPTGLEPEAQAKLEWDGDPLLRARNNNNEKSFLLFRVNQLKGNVRVLKTA